MKIKYNVQMFPICLTLVWEGHYSFIASCIVIWKQLPMPIDNIRYLHVIGTCFDLILSECHVMIYSVFLSCA